MRGVDPDSEGSPSKVLWSLCELLWGHMLWGEKKLPGFSPALGFLQPLDVLVLSEQQIPKPPHHQDGEGQGMFRGTDVQPQTARCASCSRAMSLLCPYLAR